MADSTEKKIVITLKGNDDGASATMDKVGRKVDSLEYKLKKIGTISGVGGFKQASDVAEGFGGQLGDLGKLAGAAAGIAAIGSAMKGVGDAIQGAVDRGESFIDTMDGLASKIPVLGRFKEGVESLSLAFGKLAGASGLVNKSDAESFGTMFARGFTLPGQLRNTRDAWNGDLPNIFNVGDKQRGKELDADTKKIRDQIEADKKDREESDKVLRQNLSGRMRIEAERDAALEAVMERRRKWMAEHAGISDKDAKRYASEEQLIRQQADMKLKKIIDDGNAAIEKAQSDRLKVNREYQERLAKTAEETASMQREAVALQAQIIAANFRAAGNDVEAQITELRDRVGRQQAELDEQIRRIKNDPNFIGDKTSAVGALQNQRDSLGILRDNEERRTRAKAERDRIKQNTDAIADATKEAMDEAARKRDERIERGRESLGSQSSARTSILDARGQTAFQTQMREFITPTTENTKATAENTKAAKDLRKSIDDLVSRVGESQGIGALIG